MTNKFDIQQLEKKRKSEITKEKEKTLVKKKENFVKQEEAEFLSFLPQVHIYGLLQEGWNFRFALGLAGLKLIDWKRLLNFG